MVRHHAPPQWGFDVDIGHQGPGAACTFTRQYGQALRQVMQRCLWSVQAVNTVRLYGDGTLRKDGFKAGAYGCRPHDAVATGVNADDLVIVPPHGHHFVDVACLHGFIELRFGFIGRAENGCKRGNLRARHRSGL
jgi:hypothetical protein